MEQFTIYYGTPEGKATKIGVDCNYPSRIKDQKIMDGQILEVHTCVYEVSDREMELQRQYGVKVDTIPYHVMYFKNKSAEMRAKVSIANTGKERTEENKAKISAAMQGNTNACCTKGKPQKQVQCPQCLKTGGIYAMKRWHFDNCKHIYAMNE